MWNVKLQIVQEEIQMYISMTLEVGNDFLNKKQKAPTIKEKIDQFDSLKLRILLTEWFSEEGEKISPKLGDDICNTQNREKD